MSSATAARGALRAAPPRTSGPAFLIAGADLEQQHGPGHLRPALPGDGARWLGDSAQLQTGHDRIRLLATRLTQLKASPVDKAVACYQRVRDMPFYCSADPAGTPSVAVLAAQFGDCFTKGVLLVALLRACAIPARLRFVLVKPDHLRGLANAGRRPLLHAYTEALVGPQGWMGLDSYILDLKLSLAARCALINEGRLLGYGVHLHGQVAWDGRCSSFCAFAADDPASQPTADLGPFDDVAQFTATHPAFLPGDWLARSHWAFAASVTNRRIKRLRGQRPL